MIFFYSKKKEYGTPEEDAYRRDMTINSLFYNIHTHKVEDFTKKVLILCNYIHRLTEIP